MRARFLVTGLAVSVLGLAVTDAQAVSVTPGWECIPTTAGQPVVSGGTAAAPSCGAGTTAVLAPTYIASGAGGKPTAEFAAINVQIVNGTGSEATLNGMGNLVVGYDENPGAQTGSHNLLVGGSNAYTSYGGIDGGLGNRISGSYASALGGNNSVASGYASTITGGSFNVASANFAAISGGCSNVAGASAPVVNAFCTNTSRTGDYASILGGVGNQARALDSAASGGAFNLASANESSILGGEGNVSSSTCQAIPAAPVNHPC